MAQVLKRKRISRTGLAVTILAVALALQSGLAWGQSAANRKHAYRGTATVSVATLKVPEQAWKHLEKARALALKHNVSESVRESEKALAIAPEFPTARLFLADQELLLKDFAAAISNVAQVRKTDPDAPWIGVIMAAAYNGLQRYDDAMEELQSLPPAEAETWQAKYEQARAATGQGDVEEALKLSAEALELSPKDFTDTILVRSNALILAHHWKEAKDCLSDYLALPGPLKRREQVQNALASVTRRMKAEPEEMAALASR